MNQSQPSPAADPNQPNAPSVTACTTIDDAVSDAGMPKRTGTMRDASISADLGVLARIDQVEAADPGADGDA